MGRLPRKSKKISCRLTFLAGEFLDAELTKLPHNRLGRQTGAYLSRLLMAERDRRRQPVKLESKEEVSRKRLEEMDREDRR
jgi:hypothetical protein